MDKNQKRMLVFAIIPIVLLLILISGKYSVYQGNFTIQGNHGPNMACNNESNTRGLVIKPFGNPFAPISYFLQSKVELPLNKLCIGNDGARYNDLIIDTFESKVMVKGEEINIPYNQEKCINLDLESNSLDMLQFSNYCYFYNSSDRPQSDFSNGIIWTEKVKLDYSNLLLQWVIWILALWAILLICLEIMKFTELIEGK